MTTNYQDSSIIRDRTSCSMTEPDRFKKASPRTLVMLIRKKSTFHRKRGIFNLKAVCVAIIFGIIISINQSLMSSIMKNTRIRSRVNSNNISNGYNTSLNSINNGVLSDKGSLITLAEAAPGPGPAAVSARVHKVPPMNGSIFGKRSLGSAIKAQPKSRSQIVNHFERSPTQNYLDVVTDIIERFMSNNSEGDPEKATTNFCRMIVYECNQYLHLVDKKRAISRQRARRMIRGRN